MTNYIAICRSLFSDLGEAFPCPAIRHAFSSVEGPPRLLLLLFWALQSTHDLTDLLDEKISPASLRNALARRTDSQVASALTRAANCLPKAQVPVYLKALCAPTTRLICALALLGEAVRLTDKLDNETTIATAISRGHAQSMPGDRDNSVILHWPRLFIWYFQKVRSSRVVPSCSHNFVSM